MTTLHLIHDVATVFASAFVIALMFAALVLAAPFVTLVSLLCAAGVFKSHGGVGPRKTSSRALSRALSTPEPDDAGEPVKMLFGNSSGVFEALAAALERDAARARRRRVRRLRWIQLRRALREALRSRLAAITLGTWIAVALIRAWEVIGHA